MTENYKKSKLLILLLLTSTLVQSQSLLHYWNFNNNASVASITTPTTSIIAGVSLIANGGANSSINFLGGTGQGFDNQNLNTVNNDFAGTHLRFDLPIGGTLLFSLPTTGYENIIVKFATRRSSSGAGTQTWFYSVDGNSYLQFSTISPSSVAPELKTLDFSSIAAANNNPNFKIKVEFSESPGGAVGNNRFDNFTTQGSEIGGGDSTAPITTIIPSNASVNVSTTANITIGFNENVRLINNNILDDTNVDTLVELRLNSSTGVIVPSEVTFSGNMIIINPNVILTNNQNYFVVLQANTLEDFSNNAITTAQSSIFTTGNPTVSLASNFITVSENVGNLNFLINLVSPNSGSVDLVLKFPNYNTANSGDFIFITQTINFTENSNSSQSITIPIIDDTLLEQQAEYFVLSLENPIGFVINGSPTATIFIKDNDRIAKIPSQQIELNYVGSFDPSGANTSTCEIVVHDPSSQRLFTTSAVAGFLDIIDFSNPTSPSVLSSVNMNVYGGVTSVAVKNGIVAVASPNTDETLDGSVVFFDTNGVFLKQVIVGALPDMICFSPDGSKVITANEGQPNANYSVDPEGSVSIIDISGGITNLLQSNVSTLLFTQFNSQEATLITNGVRKLKSTSTLSQDFEPEYVTIDASSQKAWVVLQENNAVAEINLLNKTFTNLWPLGKKDMSLVGNGFDISDNNNQVLIANWPVKAFFNPDAIANYNVNGTNYLITANEGDEKEYIGFTERTTVGANSYILDPILFPNANVLKQTYNMGRFRVTNLNGNLDTDTDFEEINCVGTRSFSIFNSDTKQLIFDSGDDFEMFTAANLPTLFNADHGDNISKGRSRSKGPEPEGVTTATIGGQTFAFISLERVGGVMVYNITDPNNVSFVNYKNSRSTSSYSGDLGPEGITYISGANSATGKSYILVANEISGTITVFEIDENLLSTSNNQNEISSFNIFPNPSEKGIVYLNKMANITVFDITGKTLFTQKNAQSIDTKSFASGIYFVKTSDGITKQLVIK